MIPRSRIKKEKDGTKTKRKAAPIHACGWLCQTEAATQDSPAQSEWLGQHPPKWTSRDLLWSQGQHKLDCSCWLPHIHTTPLLISKPRPEFVLMLHCYYIFTEITNISSQSRSLSPKMAPDEPQMSSPCFFIRAANSGFGNFLEICRWGGQIWGREGALWRCDAIQFPLQSSHSL